MSEKKPTTETPPPEGGIVLDLAEIADKLDALSQKMSAMETHLSGKIVGLEDKLRHERDERLAALSVERASRESAIASERTTRESANADTAAHIGAIDKKIDSLNAGLSTTLARIGGLVESIPTILSSNAAMVAKFEKEIDRQGGRISDMNKTHAEFVATVKRTESRVDELHVNIYGGDDRRSMVKIIEDAILAQIEGNQRTQQALSNLTVQISANTAQTNSIQQRLDADDKKWAHWRTLIKQGLGTVASSRLGVAGFGLLVVIVTAWATPELVVILTAFLETIGGK